MPATWTSPHPWGAVGGVVFWQELSPENQAVLTAAGSRQIYRVGEALFHEGGTSKHLVIVLRGRVKLTRTSVDGDQALLEVRGPGSLLGEMSVFEDESRSASGWAITPVEALVLPPERFRPLFDERPDLRSDVLRDVSHRLRQSTQRQFESTVGGALERLCGRLVELAEDGTVHADGTIEIESGLTQQDLADWIGVSREAVVITLRQLRERGWVETGRKRYRVLDLEAIRAAAVA